MQVPGLFIRRNPGKVRKPAFVRDCFFSQLFDWCVVGCAAICDAVDIPIFL